MSFVLIVTLIVGTGLFILHRYLPASHVKKMDMSEVTSEDGMVVPVDTRDYQTSSQDKLGQAVCLPLAYLERHHQDIPQRPIVLICSDEVEKNLAARLLKRKGYEVIGYTIPTQQQECRAMPCMIEK
ncbi:rhodanese [Halobacillus sp. HZG1]|uniref:rhodanese-like domain-containing protein n=1 Tax=Halobacillus sp. HZG1 TaxID=3111769 RepID=UPI002DBD9889|nr:rhodanese [Halobacillus sp. HZG1]MEC3885314.1 rhodanese [Halobacillus sp. HZG1]